MTDAESKTFSFLFTLTEDIETALGSSSAGASSGAGTSAGGSNGTCVSTSTGMSKSTCNSTGTGGTGAGISGASACNGACVSTSTGMSMCACNGTSTGAGTGVSVGTSVFGFAITFLLVMKTGFTFIVLFTESLKAILATTSSGPGTVAV